MKNDNVAYLDGPKILILYASATGVSEEVAQRVGREAVLYKLNPTIYSIDCYDYENINSETRPICFICSTTGQGEEPDSMKAFWKFLLRKTTEYFLFTNIKFGVLGLGDSSYAKFNFVAKKLHKRLLKLGATAVNDVGLADDQHDLGPDAVIDPWLLQFWEKIVPNFSSLSINKYPHYLDDDRSAFSLPKFKLVPEFCYSEVEADFGNLGPHPRPPTHVIKYCQLLKNERVTAEDHFQDVRLFSIDLTDSDLSYEPGDVLMVHPSNSEANVELFFQLFPELQKERYQKYHMLRNPGCPIEARIPQEIEKRWPQPWTLDFIVRNYLDFQAVPKRYFFEILAYFSLDDLEKEKLREYSTTEGQQEMYNYCTRPKRTALEVFQDFPHSSSNVPLDYILDLIGPIKPRSFSIASSMPAHANTLQVLVALVNYKTILKAPRTGLCSNWMAGLQAGDNLPVGIRKGCFKFPKPEENLPVIMVGPGTGCAPFRSLISAHHADMDLTMFFGCRFKGKDSYFQDEWSLLEQKNQLKIFTAFSRDNPGGSRTYVQHKIAEQADLICDLIACKGAIIYIAGNAKNMPTDVYEAFKKILEDRGCEDADDFIDRFLIQTGRYQTEVWS